MFALWRRVTAIFDGTTGSLLTNNETNDDTGLRRPSLKGNDSDDSTLSVLEISIREPLNSFSRHVCFKGQLTPILAYSLQYSCITCKPVLIESFSILKKLTNRKLTNWWCLAIRRATQLYNLDGRPVKFNVSFLVILRQTATELCASMTAAPVLRTFVQYPVAFCSRPEAALDVVRRRRQRCRPFSSIEHVR